MNNTIFIGRVCSIGQFVNTENKKQKISFSLTYHDAINGKDNVCYQSIIAYDLNAKIVKKHLHLGDLVCIEGVLNNNTHDIYAKRITFLSQRKEEKLELAKDINII